ncbi:centrosomal protein of 131 kDa isoform X2 [Camelus dromedarius]|uniref:centrosomal protein of 131 kDa isoform X2 n=1 Tax=Camelus dromedarius TaxID=9838 RepID=UPI0012634F79|nr:centrosomal protein of 131 kDa isoform X2 [Camelus dromedarius]
MKGPRAIGSPAGSPGSVDLCLAGLPPPVSRRPSSASAAKPITRSVSMATGGAPGRKAPEAPGPRGSQAANNLRRSNSTTQVNQSQADHAWTGPRRPTEPSDSLLLSEGSPSERKRPAGPSRTSSEKGATWNILDDRPMAFSSPPDAPSPSALDVPACPRRRECTVPLAPTFTANNRSSKGAVGNCVTTMVHNHYPPSEKAPPPPKSSNHMAPSLNNIVKATTGEGESCSFGKAQKNVARSNHAVQSNSGGAAGQLRRKEVTEEEAERFIHQVNQAAATIQRWYRHQVQRRRAGAASVQCLLESKQAQRQRLGEGTLLEQHQQKEAARRRAREEKARQARRAAIQELQQKRAQKSGNTDLGLLKGTRETGKPQPTQELPLSPGSAAQETRKASNAGAGLRAAGPEDPRQPAPDTALEPQQFPEDKPQDASSQDTAAGEILEVVAPTEGRAKSRATLDDLLDTLKLLEQEPEPLPRPRAYLKDKYAWTDEEDYASSLTAHNLERFGRLSVAASPPEDGALLSEAKLRSILRFLDETEESGQRQAAPAPQVWRGLREGGRPPLGDEGLPDAAASQGHVPEEGLGCSGPASEASTSAMRLQLEVEEKKQAMVLLQRALAQQRDLTVRRVKETEKELGRQLRQQREHYEATIQRHLSFIDQLIEDKKALGEKCEALVAELKQGDQRRKDREAQMQEQHELEIKKLKELMSATEKVRREKWISEKTRKIKEITVKGLEPEIQKLIARHKQEVKKLKSQHAAELLQADERAAQRYGRQAEELRQHLEREKEALGRQEWERAQQRFEQHLEQEQRALEQQRRRLHSEVAEEKERLGQQAARQRAELEELRQQLEESSSAGGRALRAEFEKRREEQERRHLMELKALKDQLEVEKQMWEANSAKKEEAWLLSRERELKEEVRRGRDEEIERVVRRLEADMTLAREESERAAESRIKRVRDKYEAELSELERSERKLQERCAELKGRLGEAEGESVRLQGLVRQKEKELADVRAVSEQLAGERSGLAQVLRQEFADRLAASEEENRQVRAELAELRARQRLELEQLTREKQAELEEVHGRVKVALAKKEEAVNSLRKQHEAAMKRADHLEELLEQHGRPFPSAK